MAPLKFALARSGNDAFDRSGRSAEEEDHPRHRAGTGVAVGGQLAERIALLKDEIARLETEMKRKNASKSAADMFFKKYALEIWLTASICAFQANLIW